MAKVKTQKTRKLSIRIKVLIPVFIIIMAICMSLGTVTFLVAEWAMTNTGMEKSHLAASIACSMINGDNIAQIKASNRRDFRF